MFSCIKNIFNDEFNNIKSLDIILTSKCILLNKLLLSNKDKYAELEQQKNIRIMKLNAITKKYNISKNLLTEVTAVQHEKIIDSMFEMELMITGLNNTITLYEDILIQYSHIIDSFKKEVEEYYYMQKNIQ